MNGMETYRLKKQLRGKSMIYIFMDFFMKFKSKQILKLKTLVI